MTAIPSQWSRVRRYLPGQPQLTNWLKQSLLSAAGILVFVLLWRIAGQPN
ncbi:nitrate transporter [Alishewanella longhuensis]